MLRNPQFRVAGPSHSTCHEETRDDPCPESEVPAELPAAHLAASKAELSKAGDKKSDRAATTSAGVPARSLSAMAPAMRVAAATTATTGRRPRQSRLRLRFQRRHRSGPRRRLDARL